MIPLQYTYFFATMLSCLVWIVMYYWRKDLRRQMIIMSMIICIVGVIQEYLWYVPYWWHPQTITGTKVGVEDILLAFSNGGIAAVLYEEVFKKRLYKKEPKNHTIGMIVIIVMSNLLFGMLFWGFQLTSFIACTISLISSGLVLIFLRRDLFYDALLTGLMCAIGALPIFWIIIFVSPHFIDTTWAFKNLSGIRFTGAPTEDIIFYFSVGFIYGPLYLYWKSEGLRKIAT